MKARLVQAIAVPGDFERRTIRWAMSHNAAEAINETKSMIVCLPIDLDPTAAIRLSSAGRSDEHHFTLPGFRLYENAPSRSPLPPPWQSTH